MDFRLRFFFPCLFGCVISVAQNPVIIEGRVIDAETRQGIPFAHVFISNTTSVSVTDESGKFRLAGLPDGRGQLVVSYVGYENYTMELDPHRKEGKIEIRLRPKDEALESVVTIAATEDKEWQRNLKTFKRDFLGKTANSKACELLNPWVLEFDKKSNTFIANASAPVEIMNEALGYEVTFYLNTFQSNATEYSIVGPVRFRELDDPSRLEEWEKNRQAVFMGSVKHFFQSLWKDQHKQNEFRMYRSVNALADEQRSLRFESDLGRRVKEVKREDVVRDDAKEGLAFFSLKPVEVHYLAGRDFEPVYQDVLHHVSWIQASGGLVRFDSAGNILNPQDVIVSGYWNRLRVADLLPLDYEKGRSLQIVSEPEKLSVTTDKGAYANGSKIYYTVYSSGRSVTVNVDLLGTEGQVLSSRVDPLERGVSSGFFEVPMGEGPFFIRAVTTKSMSDGGAFIKPIVKQRPNAQLVCNGASSDLLKWKLDSLEGREMLTLSMQDIDGDTLTGHYTLSITNPGLDCDCTDGWWSTFKGIETEKNSSGGVPAGRVVDKRGSPQSGKLNFFASDLSYSLERNVGKDGRFRLEDVIHYDTTRWMVQLYDRKNKPVQDFEIEWDKEIRPTLPGMDLKKPQCLFKETEVPVARAKHDYGAYVLSDSTRVLNEVTVRSRKISRDARPNTTFRSYGTPQYVIKGEEMINNPSGVNVLHALSGRVPGLIISDVGTAWTGETIRIQIRGQSTFAKQEPPLIIVDGLPFDELDQAYNMLQTIPLTDIDRVEVRTALSPMQGMRGANGVIAVYTKRTNRTVSPLVKANSLVKSVTIKGYSAPARFQRDSTDVTTFYWDPAVEFSWRPVMIERKDLPDVVEVLISGIDPTGRFFTIRRRLDLNSRRPAQLGSTSN